MTTHDRSLHHDPAFIPPIGMLQPSFITLHDAFACARTRCLLRGVNDPLRREGDYQRTVRKVVSDSQDADLLLPCARQ